MKFQKQQVRSEFGRAWVPAGQQAPQAEAPAGGVRSAAASGRAVASFYADLVQTSGVRWVSGGTLADADKAAAAGSSSGVAALLPSAAEAPGAVAAEGAAEPSHAGLGSVAARAELAAEARQLQYDQPAGPLLRGEREHGGQQEQVQQEQVQQEQEQGVGERQQQRQQPPAGWLQQQQGAHQGAQQQQQQQQMRVPREGIKYGIARSNLGYQLLKKAGWREGAGLGAQEQGPAEPVQAFQQQGKQGLGHGPKGKSKAAQQGAGSGEQGRQQGGAAGGQKQGGGQQQKRALPEDPLANEDQDTKVKRVRQVMQAEADARAGKAIERYMRMAFNDATGEATADSNPLLRRNHKLSATNPLL